MFSNKKYNYYINNNPNASLLEPSMKDYIKQSLNKSIEHYTNKENIEKRKMQKMVLDELNKVEADSEEDKMNNVVCNIHSLHSSRKISSYVLLFVFSIGLHGLVKYMEK